MFSWLPDFQMSKSILMLYNGLRLANSDGSVLLMVFGSLMAVPFASQ